jgi:hypothetical protein
MHACLYANLHHRLHTHPRKHTRNVQAHMHAVHIHGSRNDTALGWQVSPVTWAQVNSPGDFVVCCNSSYLHTFYDIHSTIHKTKYILLHTRLHTHEPNSPSPGELAYITVPCPTVTAPWRQMPRSSLACCACRQGGRRS